MAQALNSAGRVGSASRATWFKKLEMFLTTIGAVFADAREMERKAHARYPFVDWQFLRARGNIQFIAQVLNHCHWDEQPGMSDAGSRDRFARLK